MGGVDALGVADVVGEQHRRQRQRSVAVADDREVLLGAHHERAERGPLGLAHDLAEQTVGSERSVVVTGGDEEVRMIEVHRVDVGEVDELLDVDRSGLARLDRLELEIGDDHLIAVVQLVAVGDLLAGDLDLLLRTPALHLDRRAVLLMELAEMEVEIAGGGHHRDRHVDEAEAERACPQRTRHGSALRSQAGLECRHQILRFLRLRRLG